MELNFANTPNLHHTLLPLDKGQAHDLSNFWVDYFGLNIFCLIFFAFLRPTESSLFCKYRILILMSSLAQRQAPPQNGPKSIGIGKYQKKKGPKT